MFAEHKAREIERLRRLNEVPVVTSDDPIEVNANNEVIAPNQETEANVEPLDERFALLEELFEETVDVADQMDVVQFEAPKVQLRGFQNFYIAFFAICVVYIQLFYLPELAAEFVMVVINAAANLFQCTDIFPKKLDTLRNHVDIEFAYKGMYRLIVCPECNTLYKPETAQYAPICTSKKFGVICGAVLIQNLVPGARKMYGNLVAPFNNIQHALTLMFARDGFESLIEVWRGRTRHQDTIHPKVLPTLSAPFT
ncbi:hypothetical protein G6F56_012501 [Rhizopus delemar]|nr:hypothetical protein G6F56_012501 [Rhizopus delemar]